ncbi:redoxin domain-containing protein [Acetobacterium tundrae]|uniref:Redoxin domain-containing protein n=1 Tax=Acetobacterium tundrae TaxID=132932 RepID=A0ABR6WKK6_9FIRM|nr:redoxin domain-containing protein [Acetobacterium tundrae]MBC3796811.1 redoxin domain-containing protein [Acetobacterium tundrae]
MANIIKVGEKAPDFKLQDQSEKEISLSLFKGKKVLLSWHPLAWTAVCTDQMRSLERNFKQFEEKNTVVLGLSIDSQPSKSVWARVLCLNNIKILADFNPLGEVSRKYGIFREDRGSSERANILIDENGMVIWAKLYEIHTLPDVAEILQQL